MIKEQTETLLTREKKLILKQEIQIRRWKQKTIRNLIKFNFLTKDLKLK